MGAQAKKASMIRRGITAMVGMAVVAGTLIGVAAPASASISNASISPATWTPSEQAAATVTWTESAATTTNNIYTSGDYLSVEVGWGWTLANANPTGTPVQYTATWDGTAKTYSCATIGVVFASTGFTNTGGDIRCYVKQSSASAGNPGQQVVLSSVSGSNYFGLTAGSTINVTFAAGKVTAPSAGPASDTWRIISLTAAQTTTVTTVVPGVDAAGNAVSLITLDFDPNGGTCTTSKVTGVSGSWGVAPDATDCARSGYSFTGWNTSANGKGIWILPKGNINFTGDNRVYAQWVNPYTEVFPAGKPVNVVATSKWNRVQVNWDAPSDSGSYPITNYLVTASPSNRVCITTLADKKFTQCSFNNAVPGTQYTYTVQALNGAGWSDRSVASNVASPYTLKITKFQRDKVLFGLGGSKIKLVASTPGYAPGVKVTPSVSYDGGKKWTQLAGNSFRTKAAIANDVTLSIARGSNKTTVSVKFVDAEGNESNVVEVKPAR